MGVRDLTAVAKRYAPDSITTYSSIRDFRGKRFAIDANLLTTKFHFANAYPLDPLEVAADSQSRKSNDPEAVLAADELYGYRHARAWYYFIRRLQANRIEPIVVFDGATRLDAKARENERRRRAREVQRLRSEAERVRGERLRDIRRVLSGVDEGDRGEFVAAFRGAARAILDEREREKRLEQEGDEASRSNAETGDVAGRIGAVERELAKLEARRRQADTVSSSQEAARSHLDLPSPEPPPDPSAASASEPVVVSRSDDEAAYLEPPTQPTGLVLPPSDRTPLANQTPQEVAAADAKLARVPERIEEYLPSLGPDQSRNAQEQGSLASYGTDDQTEPTIPKLPQRSSSEAGQPPPPPSLPSSLPEESVVPSSALPKTRDVEAETATGAVAVEAESAAAPLYAEQASSEPPLSESSLPNGTSLEEGLDRSSRDVSTEPEAVPPPFEPSDRITSVGVSPQLETPETPTPPNDELVTTQIKGAQPIPVSDADDVPAVEPAQPVDELVSLFKAHLGDATNPVYSRNQVDVFRKEAHFFSSLVLSGPAAVSIAAASLAQEVLRVTDIQTEDAPSPVPPASTDAEAIRSTAAAPSEEVPAYQDDLHPLIERSRELQQSHDQRSRGISPIAFSEVRTLIQSLGIPWLQPTSQHPHEAEGVCAALQRQGLVDFVVSEDTDVVVYGAPVLRNITLADQPKVPMSVFDPVKLREGLGLSSEEFVDFALLLGTDFTERIKGFGPVAALKAIRQHRTLEAVLAAQATRLRLEQPFTDAYLDTAQVARNIFLEPPALPSLSVSASDAVPGSVLDVDDEDESSSDQTFLGSLSSTEPSRFLPVLLAKYRIKDPSTPGSDEMRFALDDPDDIGPSELLDDDDEVDWDDLLDWADEPTSASVDVIHDDPRDASLLEPLIEDFGGDAQTELGPDSHSGLSGHSARHLEDDFQRLYL